MKLLWTRRNNFGSRLIEWGTDGDCSHFAVVFDEKPGGYGLVFHSHSTGVGLDWYGSFCKDYEIVHSKTLVGDLDEEAVYQALVARFYKKPYDKLAFLYLGLCLAAHKFFGRPMPNHNQWGNKDAFLCTEIAQALKESGVIGIPNLDDFGMISPISLFKLIDSPSWQ